MLLLKQPYKQKPHKFLQPDLAHPTLRGCVGLWSFLEGAGDESRDQFNRWDVSLQANAQWQNGDLYTTGAANSVAFTDRIVTHGIGVGDFSFVFRAKCFDTSPSYSAFAAVGSFDPGIYYRVQNSGWGMYWGTNLPADTVLAENIWYTGVIVRQSTVVRYYLDGRSDGETSSMRSMPNAVVRFGDNGNNAAGSDGVISQFRFYNRALEPSEARHISGNLWEPWSRRVWVPVEAGPPGPVQLNIDDLRHARPVDQVDVTVVVTLVELDIDFLRHRRRVDSLILGISVDLFLASLRHARPVDAVTLDVSVDLAINALRHARVVDAVDLQELVGIVIDISDLRHRRPVDSVLLDVDQPIVIDSLRHARPVDAVGVQLLLGDQTGIGATVTNWVLDAGQQLNNAALVDFDYHVIEGVFDSDQSLLGVDGTRVTGSAGMRELTALTLGANVDGQERVQGEIAELRIYAGALNQADRDRILQELTAKWITG